LARQGEWPVLEGLDAAARASLLQRSARRKFDRHEIVFHENDPGDTFHLIEEGLVEIQITTPLGDVATLAILGRGDFFGELALILPGGRRTATARALEPVRTWMVSREVFEELCREHPAVARFLTNALAIKVRDLSAQVVDALYVPADRRVLRRLLDVVDLFRRDAEGLVVTLTQDNLASLAGTARPTVNRVLKQAEQAGLVSVGRGHVTILNYEGLVRKAR
jgi:CRP/FNR family transcriptional regulator, cyclic AMP receptor protein